MTRELELSGLESPRVEAERLVSAALQIERSDLRVEGGAALDTDEARAVARAVARRIAGEPLQHVEGTVDFRRLELVSDGRALIPRPETEQLIDMVHEAVRRAGPFGRVLEIGVGSGALSLALLEEGLAVRVVAVDVAEDALEQAAENAARTRLAARLDLRRCSPSVWPDLADEPPFEAVVSNPPYVATRDIESLAAEVRDHDPRVALDGGADGLAVLRVVIAGAADAVVPGGRLFLEIGADHGSAVESLLVADGRWADVAIRPDLAGRQRFALATRTPDPPEPR